MEFWCKEYVFVLSLKIRFDNFFIKFEFGKDVFGLLVGYCCDLGELIYIDDEYLMWYLFIFGQFGVGKIVVVLLLMFQQIQWGGGLLFIDGKIDVKNIEQIYYYCCYMGWQYDFLVINFDDLDNFNIYNFVFFGDVDEKVDGIFQFIFFIEINFGVDFYKQEVKQVLIILI